MFSVIALFFIGSIWAHGIFDDSKTVVKLTNSNFESLVEKDKGLWIVMFYANWCGHCKNFAPEFAKASDKLEGLVKFGVVDCDSEINLARKNNVEGFPTIKIFGKDKSKGIDYSGGRTADAVISELADVISKAAGKSSSSRGSGSSGSGSDGDVVILNKDNFDELVLKSDKPWLVKFFAPWCGHCKAMYDDYKKAATEVKEKVMLGEVDATVEKELSSRFGIQGFPTLKYFSKSSGSSGEDYNGGRSSDQIISWLEDKVGTIKEVPEVKQIVSQEVFDECMDKKLCVVSFLPLEEDTTTEERQGHVELLKSVMVKTFTETWGWTWTIGTSNEKLEEELAIDGLTYPFFVIFYKGKEAFTVLKTAFTLDRMVEFIHSVKNGKTTYSSLPKKLAPFATTKPWTFPGKEEL